MGLDISPGGASWSYFGFGRFRDRLAAEEGITLKEMSGYGGRKSWDDSDSPLVPLLDHSDCDGYLDSWECDQMIPRLTEIADSWLSAKFHDIDTYDVAQLRNLIQGMTHCTEHGCAMSFH